MYVIKTIAEQQDIYVLGINFKAPEGSWSTFMINDDESTLMLTRNKDHVYMDTEGYVSILTKQEFIDKIPDMWEEPDEDGIAQGILMKNCVGEFRLKVIDDKDQDVLTDFDENEYLMHQNCLRNVEVEDYVLELPTSDTVKLLYINELIQTLKK